MIAQQSINIKENKPSKFIESEGGCEVISNDGTLRIQLHHITLMDGSMESDSYSTVMWTYEEGGWVKVNNTQSYRTIEEFLRAINEVDDFTQAMAEYKFNNQNNNESWKK